uniref:Uncharacterized protein n=1 Tax=Amphora coffeiformis TaxID=265554 RepID=A0A7S3P8H3_9STRA
MKTLFALILCYCSIFRGTAASPRRELMMKRTMWRNPHQAWFTNPHLKSQQKEQSAKGKGQVWRAKATKSRAMKWKGKGMAPYQWRKSKSGMDKSSSTMKNTYKGKGYQQMKQGGKGKGSSSSYRGKGYSSMPYKGKGNGAPSGCVPLHQNPSASVQENGLQSSGYFSLRKSPALESPPLLSPHFIHKKQPPYKGYITPAIAPSFYCPETPNLPPALAPRSVNDSPPIPAPTQVPTPSPTLGCGASTMFITDFVIVDADSPISNTTSDYLFSIEEGAAYSLSDIAAAFGATNLALICITDPAPFVTIPFQVGSVGLRDNLYQTHIGLDGFDPAKNFNTENSPPYVLADALGGSYGATDFTLAESWSVTCQAFCEPNLGGEASAPVTRTFRMIA